MAEAEATERALALAEATGTPIYVVHMTCARAVDALQRAQARGQVAFGETCPQYLLLDEDVYETEDFDAAAGYVLSPPLRARSNQAALWAALAASTIQTVGTDHCPFTREQKARGRDDFTQIPGGLPGIENNFCAAICRGALYSYAFYRVGYIHTVSQYSCPEFRRQSPFAHRQVSQIGHIFFGPVHCYYIIPGRRTVFGSYCHRDGIRSHR